MTEYANVLAEAAQRSRHYTARCVCGRQIRTCRCIGPKDTYEVSPCRHRQEPLRIRLLQAAEGDRG